MIKSISSLVSIISILLFAVLAEVGGVYYMADSAINKNENFLMGFSMFSFGLIIFLCIAIANNVTKMMKSTNLIANSLADLMELMIKENNEAPPTHISQGSLMDLLKGKMGGTGGTFGFGNTTVHISSIDEDGNVSPLLTKSFEKPEDFFKHRDSIIAQALGQQPGEVQKKIDDMSLEELNQKEQEAAAAQKFELAAAYRDAINRKKNPEQ